MHTQYTLLLFYERLLVGLLLWTLFLDCLVDCCWDCLLELHHSSVCTP